jgi:hypothetical protein
MKRKAAAVALLDFTLRERSRSLMTFERLDRRKCDRREINSGAHDSTNPEHAEHEHEEPAQGCHTRPANSSFK